MEPLAALVAPPELSVERGACEGPAIHRAAATSAPVKIVLVSAASASGKSFSLRRLLPLDEFRDVVVYEMDALFYYVPGRLAAALGPASERFEAWRSAESPSRLGDEIARNLEASTDEHRLIKLKLLELAAGDRRVVTVNPETVRHDPEAVRFLRMLERYFSIRVRHVLLDPTLPRYLANLFRRHGEPWFDPRWYAERRLLHRKQRLFDAVLRRGLRSPEAEIERFFREQLG